MSGRKREPSVNKIYSDYVANCRRRNIFFELTKEDLARITQLNCHYCDKEPSNMRRGYRYTGLDRIDNKKGYTRDNVLPACVDCNFLRGNRLSVEEMEVVAKALSVFRLNNAK